MKPYFQEIDSCVLACSGPSLNKVDVFSLGLPVVAVSTAIRKIPNPDFWALADRLNKMHGQEGERAWSSKKIIKIVPQSKIIKGDDSFIRAEYKNSGRQEELTQTLFVPGLPLLRGPHKSVTFIIQWLHINGIKNIIFAGNDLKANSFEEKYAYKLETHDMRKKGNFKTTLDQVAKTMKAWYPIAKSKGFEWYSWECGEEFEKLVPKFTRLTKFEFKTNKGLVNKKEKLEEAYKRRKTSQEILNDSVERLKNSFKK